MSEERVGVVGDERLVGPVEAAGCEAIVDELEAFESTRFVLAAGEAALVDLARASVDVPVLPIAVGGGFDSVPFESVSAALERVLETEPETADLPIVEARGSFDPIPALFDVALMAAEPARISEFSVHSDDALVSRFRSDGVVVSTPAGSGGYNRAAGGPIVESETDVVSVVPIAPFAMAADRWVLPIDAVSFAVERDETPVELLVDGRHEGIVEPGDRITISRAGALETYVISQSE